MISCDTNILVYALNSSAPEHSRASRFIAKHLVNREFVLSEFVLFELYVLLRNPKVFMRPLIAHEAVEQIIELKSNPYWTIVKGTNDVSDFVWTVAALDAFPRRAIFDARLAFSLWQEGVTLFATRNVSDFTRFEVFEVFDPISEPD